VGHAHPLRIGCFRVACRGTPASVIDFGTQWPSTGFWTLQPSGTQQADGGNPGGQIPHHAWRNGELRFVGQEDEDFVRDLTVDMRVRTGVDDVAPLLGGNPNSQVGRFVVFVSRALAQGGYPHTAVHFPIEPLPRGDT